MKTTLLYPGDRAWDRSADGQAISWPSTGLFGERHWWPTMSETKAPDPTGKPPIRRRLIAAVYADMVGNSCLHPH